MSGVIDYIKAKALSIIAGAVAVFALMTGAITFDYVQVITAVVLLWTAVVIFRGDDEHVCDGDHDH